MSGIAALPAALGSTPGAAFLAAPSISAARPKRLSAVGTLEQHPSETSATFATAGLTSAACTLAAAAVVAAGSRRRNVACKAKLGQPRPVINWQVEEVVPEQDSEKMLSSMVGSDVEIGDGKAWDPLGFGKLFDRNFEMNMVMVYPHVQWLREAEVKHGRICMIAFVGMVVQKFVTIPGLPVEHDWTKALAACYEDKNATLGIIQISLFTMLVEGKYYPGDAWLGKLDREAGDYGFDPLKLAKKPGFDLKTAQLKELKNGRLAMIGVASMAAAYSIPGSVPFLASFATKPETTSNESSTFCGETRTAAMPAADALSKVAARYTTQVILPSLTWIKTGLKGSDLAPTELRAKNLAGTDVLVGKDEGGKVFCVGNLCPHIGTPMSEGADVIGDVIVCPLHGSSFKTTTGELIDWCPSPPIIGPLTGLVIEKKNLAVFDVRQSFFGGGEIEVLIDTNAKRAYEADYWKGVLDAQGKDDGTFY